MQGRMGEVSASTKQDRLPQLFLINKFPGPFEFFRRGVERYVHMEGGTPRTVTTWGPILRVGVKSPGGKQKLGAGL